MINTEQKYFDRITLLGAAIFVFGLLIIFRLYQLQIVDAANYQNSAASQHEILQELPSERGSIFVADPDGSLIPLATGKEYHLIYSVPEEIVNPTEIAKRIVALLPLEESLEENQSDEELDEPEDDSVPLTIQEKTIQELVTKFSKEGDLFEVVWRKADEELLKSINDLNIKGLYSRSAKWRYYPYGPLASHIIGFFGFGSDGEKRVGSYGVEGWWNEELSGTAGLVKSARDRQGRRIVSADEDYTAAEDGVDLVLTIDRTIQHQACQVLASGVEKYDAESGSLVILDPKNGAILAMCNVPDFDPNEYWKVDSSSVYNNRSIYEAYEVGSIFKPITIAAAMDAGKVRPDTKYLDEGELKIGPFTIRNSTGKAYGRQSMSQVLEKSLNLGTIFASTLLGNDLFREYVEGFGLGKSTGIEMEGERPGNIDSLYRPGDIFRATASYGQGITATPLQMVTSFSAFANNGIMMEPRILKEIRTKNGGVKTIDPKAVRQVIKPQTAATISAMMVSAIENGYGQSARVEGYRIAGKTGTAQITNTETGEYDEVRTNHSFIGYGPIGNPKFVMIVKLEAPTAAEYSDSTAAPIFGDIAKLILRHLQVPPSH